MINASNDLHAMRDLPSMLLRPGRLTALERAASCCFISAVAKVLKARDLGQQALAGPILRTAAEHMGSMTNLQVVRLRLC